MRENLLERDGLPDPGLRDRRWGPPWGGARGGGAAGEGAGMWAGPEWAGPVSGEGAALQRGLLEKGRGARGRGLREGRGLLGAGPAGGGDAPHPLAGRFLRNLGVGGPQGRVPPALSRARAQREERALRVPEVRSRENRG